MIQNLWNWQHKKWPHFSYDETALQELEYQFSKKTGMILTDWLLYFGQTILDAQAHTLKTVDFLIEKARFFDCFSKRMNERQKKVIKRLFDSGYQGFEGGLSAHNYIRIAKTSASTATRDLQQMVEKKMLIRTGERKGTRYSFCKIK